MSVATAARWVTGQPIAGPQEVERKAAQRVRRDRREDSARDPRPESYRVSAARSLANPKGRGTAREEVSRARASLGTTPFKGSAGKGNPGAYSVEPEWRNDSDSWNNYYGTNPALVCV